MAFGERAILTTLFPPPLMKQAGVLSRVA